MAVPVMKVVRETVLDVPMLGQRIKDARMADPRSLKEIAGLAGMSSMNWYRIEAEDQSLPEETLRKIESVLGVDLGVKFEGDRNE